MIVRGALFQGRFKSVEIENNEHLLWVSGYINGNSEIHKILKADDNQWGSYLDCTGRRKGEMCSKGVVLGQFKNNRDHYRKFVDMVIQESGRKKDMAKYFLEKF